MLAIATTICVADDAPPSNAEHMEQLSWMLGDWTVELTADEGVPGIVEKGDPLLLEMSCESGLQGNVINTNWTVKAGDVLLVAHQAMLAWDPGKESYVSVGVNSRGQLGMSRWSKSGDKWMFETTASNPQGKVTSKHVISDIGSDQFTFETTEETLNGEPQTLGGPIIFKRVK